MTIGIALKFEGGVVLACDSQITYGAAPYKETKATSKLEQLARYHGCVMAGTSAIAKYLVLGVKQDLQNEQDLDTQKIAEYTADQMAALYRRYAEKFEGETANLADSLSCELIIAGVDGDDAQIFSVSSPGIISPEDYYAIIGSSKFYAGEVMENEFFPDMSTERTLFLATRAVVASTVMDPFVGGKIRLARIYGERYGGDILGEDRFIEIEDYAEQVFVPMVKKIAELRRHLDTAIIETGKDEKDKAIARLLDGLPIVGRISEYQELAEKLKREEEPD